jgi:GR25 family glycosyltransferase involved in LPS biosynthesis
MDGVDVIYWINLDRSKDRRDYMENLLESPDFNNIPKIRVKAVDGKTEKTAMFNKYNITRQKYTSDVEYACLLSHLESIRQFAESTYTGVALILEDDITLEYRQFWNKTVSQIIKRAPANWDIIQLCYINTDLSKIPKEDFSDKQYSTAAYIINKNSAVRFINQIYYNGKYRLDNTPAHVADVYIYTKLKTYTYKYPMFIYKMENTSTIHADHLSDHVVSRKLIEKHIYGMVDKMDASDKYWWVYILVLVIMVIVLTLTFQRWFYKATRIIMSRIK